MEHFEKNDIFGIFKTGLNCPVLKKSFFIILILKLKICSGIFIVQRG